MESLLTISVTGQITLCTLAICLNSIFVGVILKTTGLGLYRWIILSYALFEILYAATVLVGLPIHFVWEKTWIFFSYRGPLIGTPGAFLGSAVYCLFYELWMGLVVIHFVYRYVAVCRQNWVAYIESNTSFRFCLSVIFLLFVSWCLTCTLYWCAVNKITRVGWSLTQSFSQKMEDKIVFDFGIKNVRDIGYTMLRLVDIDGKPSLSGISATVTHFLIVAGSAATIIFCAWNIWKELRKMRNCSRVTQRHLLEKQLFLTLILQTIIPVILCHIPSAINISYPFWDHVFFEPITPFFAMFTTIPKALDPVIAVFCIGIYRRTFLSFFGFSAKRTSNVMVISNFEHIQVTFSHKTTYCSGTN